MTFVTPSSAGVSDAVMIHKLREFTKDLPLFWPEQVTANGTTTEYKLTKFPVLDGDPYLSIKVAGNPQTPVASRADLTGPGQVAIDYETGWMFWHESYPPPAGGGNNIQIRKYTVKWRDEKMLEALYNGLKLMFPRVWQQVVDDTSITLRTNKWDYALPDIFNDPRVRLFRVEVQTIPNTTERFRILKNWRRVGNTVLQLPSNNSFTPGSKIRLTYAGPYQALSDLEDQLTPVPLLYAKGYLLSNEEIVRARLSTANITQDENAHPPGVSQNAGAFFFKQFEDALVKLNRPMPAAPLQTSSTV